MLFEQLKAEQGGLGLGAGAVFVSEMVCRSLSADAKLLPELLPT